MSDLIEAMAVALFNNDDRYKHATWSRVLDRIKDQFRSDATAALAALRETHHLIPKDQEPVALMHDHIDGDREFVAYRNGAGRITEGDRKAGWVETPLYALEKRHGL